MNSSKTRSVRQENEVADAMRSIYGSAHVQPGSGNQPGKPNDVIVPQVAYVECKETSFSRITFHYEWLQRLRKLSVPLRGYLAIKFSSRDSANYYVVEDTVFEHLLKCERDLMLLVKE